MPRSRLISIFPEGAIRLVPTLITTRIVWRDCGPGQPAILRCRETPTRRTRRPPAGRDNISILPLEWLSGKVINCRIGSLYACFERHQPLFRSRGKLCALQAGISSGSLAGATCNSSLPRNSDSENPATSGGKGQHLYPAVRMAG